VANQQLIHHRQMIIRQTQEVRKLNQNITLKDDVYPLVILALPL